MIARRHFCLAAAAAATTLQGVPTASQAARPLLFNSFLPPTHPVAGKILKPWAEEIARATSGRVVLEIPSGSVAPPTQQLDAASKGIFDIGYHFLGNLADRIKLPQMTNLPLLHANARASSVALWRTHARYFERAAEFKEVHVLGFWVMSPATIFLMKKPVTTVKEFDRLKVWSTPGFPARVMEGLGASVVAAPAVRSYEMISGGTVDAFASYAVSDAVAFNTLQYAKHVIDLPGFLQAPAFALFINKRTWAALSQADRDIVSSLSGEELAQRFGLLDDIEAKSREAAVARGVQFTQASPEIVERVRKTSEPLLKDWIDDASRLGVNGKEALEFYRTEAAKAMR